MLLAEFCLKLILWPVLSQIARTKGFCRNFLKKTTPLPFITLSPNTTLTTSTDIMVRCPSTPVICPSENNIYVNGCPCINIRTMASPYIVNNFSETGVKCGELNPVYICTEEENCQEIVSGTLVCGYNGLKTLVCCSKILKGNSFPTVSSPVKEYLHTFITLQHTYSTKVVDTHSSIFENGQCGISNTSQNRVVGGYETKRGSYPWIAALGYKIKGFKLLQYQCAGSLITLGHVLTSAHCIAKTLTTIRLGAHNLDSKGDNSLFLKISKKIIYESFNSATLDNDIALLKMEKSIAISEYIRPICIVPSDENSEIPGRIAYIAGWGAIGFNKPTSEVLRTAIVPLVDRKVCENGYKKVIPDFKLLPKSICAGGGKQDSCQGDSGGPLMVTNLAPDGKYYYYNLIGIVSYGFECGRYGFPGIYSRVSSYLPWIEKNLNS